MADLKQTARNIFQSTLAAIDLPGTMSRKLARVGSQIQVNGAPFDLSKYKQIYAVAVGKGSVAMARGLAGILAPEFRSQGIVVAPAAPPDTPALEGFRLIVAGHPLPDRGSFEAGRAVLELVSSATEQDLLLFLLSGGGSALMEQPLDPAIGLEDMRELNRVLVTCGAPINEMNAVRKHLSAVKGGRLAAAAASTMKVTLGATDVPEGCESALGSGPTLPDPTTVTDACRVVERYALLPKLPPAIRGLFEHPERIPETPKEGDPGFRRAIFQIVLGHHDLFHAAHRAAEAAGFITICDNSTDDWPLERAADFLLDQLAALQRAYPARPVAVLADGEVSSPVTGTGLGGRNSALVACCLPKIAGRPVALLSAGTDGIDGSSPAAGAVADGASLERARAKGLDVDDFFRRSDTYTLFKELGDGVVTGPTGNNLRDLRILLSR